ncbi:MAG: hypothetical protein ACRDK9_03890 [Solirubrobacterales bacterium]
MADEGCIQVRLELDARSDPIVGSLRAGEGAAHEFRGWLQLIAAIEGLRAAASPGGEGPDSPPAQPRPER